MKVYTIEYDRAFSSVTVGVYDEYWKAVDWVAKEAPHSPTCYTIYEWELNTTDGAIV